MKFTLRHTTPKTVEKLDAMIAIVGDHSWTHDAAKAGREHGETYRRAGFEFVAYWTRTGTLIVAEVDVAREAAEIVRDRSAVIGEVYADKARAIAKGAP